MEKNILSVRSRDNQSIITFFLITRVQLRICLEGDEINDVTIKLVYKKVVTEAADSTLKDIGNLSYTYFMSIKLG